MVFYKFVDVQHELQLLIRCALQEKLSLPKIPPAAQECLFLHLFLKAEDLAELNDALGLGH